MCTCNKNHLHFIKLFNENGFFTSCGCYTFQQTDNICFDIAYQINRNAIESFFFIKFALNFSYPTTCIMKCLAFFKSNLICSCFLYKIIQIKEIVPLSLQYVVQNAIYTPLQMLPWQTGVLHYQKRFEWGRPIFNGHWTM